VDRLDAAHRAGEENFAAAEIVERQLLLTCLDPLGSGDLDRLLTGDAGQDPPVGWRCREPALPGAKDAPARGLEHGAIGVEEQGQLCWRCCRGAFEQPPVRPLVVAEATGDDEAAQRGASLRRWEDLVGLDLGRGDPRDQGPVNPGRNGQPQFPVADLAGAIKHLIACGGRKSGAVERRQARRQALEVGVELDGVAVEDEHRLEDPLAWVGVESR
jgi:hypothetical protein